MWIAGLRGAMAYALALKSTEDLPIGPIILIDTLLYSFLTILGIGSILHPILTRMDVVRKDPDPNAEEEPEAEVRSNCSNKLKTKIQTFDRTYFSPLFVK